MFCYKANLSLNVTFDAIKQTSCFGLVATVCFNTRFGLDLFNEYHSYLDLVLGYIFNRFGLVSVSIL